MEILQDSEPSPACLAGNKSADDHLTLEKGAPSQMPANINDRRRALAQIDNARIGIPHIRAALVARSGFFTDAYDLFSANFIASNCPTTAGAIIGQVLFGWLADKLGRKKMYGLELIIILVATFGQYISGGGPGLSYLGPLIFWRVMMGVGVGSDYPLSSIITSEFASVKWRGDLMNSVFAMQGFGNFATAMVTFVCVVAFKDSLIVASRPSECVGDCEVTADRTIVAFGALPAVFALYFRLTIPETPRYTMDVSFDVEKAKADVDVCLRGKTDGTTELGQQAEAVTQQRESIPRATKTEFYHHFKHWKHGKILLGTAGSWFFIDIAFWGLGLNNSSILNTIGYASASNVYDNLYNTAVGNLVLAVAGNIPGYWFDHPHNLVCIIGFAFHSLPPKGLLALYVLCQFFSNFGANSTTFIVPGEIFPTRFRSTARGISAGAGKLGAVIAQALLGPLEDIGGAGTLLNHVMGIFAAFMVCGIFTTLLISETKRKSLEELS